MNFNTLDFLKKKNLHPLLPFKFPFFRPSSLIQNTEFPKIAEVPKTHLQKFPKPNKKKGTASYSSLNP